MGLSVRRRRLFGAVSTEEEVVLLLPKNRHHKHEGNNGSDPPEQQSRDRRHEHQQQRCSARPVGLCVGQCFQASIGIGPNVVNRPLISTVCAVDIVKDSPKTIAARLARNLSVLPRRFLRVGATVGRVRTSFMV